MRRRRKLSGCLAAVLGVVAAGLLSFPAPATADTFTDSGFATERVATLPPFTLVGMAFAPDGRMFVWQKNGVVRIVKDGQLLATPFIDLSAKVNTFDDRGFWGFAFDPQFTTNGRIYMTYTFENAGNSNSSAPRTARLVRVQADPANPDVALAGSETVILGSVGTPPCTALPDSADCIGSEGGSHTLGSIRFAPDGTMFLGVGDGSDGNQDSLRAQDLDNPNGKILRIRTDGTALPDNPFYDGTNSWRSKVWVYGVRNPFGFTLDNGHIIFGDVGWNTWEEIDHGHAGDNFGWPCYEGNLPQPSFQQSYPAQCGAVTNPVPPFHTYNHSVGSAAIGGPIYSGTAYPSEYRNNFFFGDYSGNFIKRVVLDADGEPVSVQPFATATAAPVSLVQGPDGLIYYLSFTTGEIRRIRYNGAVAKVSATPTSGPSPLAVSFSSAGSSAPAGQTLSYLWDFGDGTTSTAANPSHTYTTATPKKYTAKLTVSTGSGSSSSDTVDVTVGSTPPVPSISAPVDGTSVIPGQVISYAGSATDPEDGPLPPSALKWTVLLHHNSHVHTFVGGSGSSGSFTAEDHGDIGTFSYELLLEATDSTGLKATTSVHVPVGNDTTPPTAPSALTATPVNQNRIDLSWAAATDNGAVSGYRVERCAGATCTNFAQVGAPTGTAFGDTGLTPATTYRYQVRAIDAAGNLGAYTSIASATTPEAQVTPPGLVGAWAFDEGAGTTVDDASGHGNQGTIAGASWTTAGRFGGALSFNGTTNLVRVADSTSLDLAGAMTLSAWIKPTVSQSGWRTIMQKQSDAYHLNASSGAGALRPAGGGTFGTSGSTVVGPTAVTVNAWTHVALTYDGTIQRLWINGTQVATRDIRGTIQATDNPLFIGGNVPYGEYFQGLIDDVRVYNRALSQSEIQGDMNMGVLPAGGGGDTSPPSAPTGLAATPVNATRIDLGWAASTDNVGVTGYRVERCAGAACTNFAQVGTPAGVTFSDTGLAGSTTYRYQVRAVDAAGNLGAYSSIVPATTPAAPDTTAPSAPAGLTATPVSTSRIDLGWTASTDNVGVTGYSVERCQGTGCTAFAEVGTPTGTAFSDTGLSAGTTYRYRVRAVDAAGNVGAYSSIVTTATPAVPDTSPPSAPTGLTATAVSATRIDLGWTASTDDVGVAGYRVERCTGAACTNFAQVGTPAGVTFSDTGLAASTTYRYQVRAVDAAGNLGDYSSIVPATTPAAPDTTAPSAPTGLTATAVGTTRIDLGWTASTDNVGVTGYRLERCQGASCTSWAQVATPTTTSYSDTGLTQNTTYRYRVRAVDAAGNLSAYSAIVNRATLAPDTTAPTAPTALAATVVSTSRIDLGWTASTDAVGVTGYRVERCQGAGCTTWAQVGTPTANSYSDTGLTPATTYRFRVRATDAAGNLSSYSSIVTAATQAAPDTTPPSAPTGVTATAGGSTVMGLSWTAATDDVGVTGYRVERCQGTSCTDFGQVGTASGTSFSDTGLTALTTYRYQVRAVDAAGNLGPYSTIASGTTLDASAPPPGLVGAWGFNEGSGGTTADGSGNGNVGTVTGAGWSTQGRFGGALSFNGSSSVVRIADSASLDVTTGVTLSAWINPAANQSGWRTILQKQTDAYFLNGSNSTGALRPSGGGTFGTGDSYVTGTTASPVNAWTHIAFSYDGTTQRLFVNGTQVATKATTGAIQTTNNPLWIGGNQPYGEYFNGLIDEVRVYNRALTPSEIQSDMNAPVPGS
ncbi:MAG TPA: LamG-like jellyroll fold domain-containing protein [Nocardioides sp.]|uniref:fibronectin type III domain-containing protein n=1 Tax=Nocardioides sp. TaxID=35761 RepID=UPI002E344B2A|nr:LamG-like jellyroll fold domain-containing protein [Nocardioides sp.]HEX5090526.1 LamG-like jellyroll fold domain-containing protein [Nocardioides sp.]